MHFWGPPRGFGKQGNKAFYFREIREQKSKTERNRGTKAILRNKEHRKWRFWFRGTREIASFFSEEQGNRYPHLEGLISVSGAKSIGFSITILPLINKRKKVNAFSTYNDIILVFERRHVSLTLMASQLVYCDDIQLLANTWLV